MARASGNPGGAHDSASVVTLILGGALAKLFIR
jgi:hypothetical protein